MSRLDEPISRSASTAAVVAIALYGCAATVPVLARADGCTYQLSAPHLVTLTGGVVQESATFVVTGCEGRVTPSVSTVCVSSDGGPGRCARSYARLPATVYADPGRGDGWVSTASGCFTTLPLGALSCVNFGPTPSNKGGRQ